MAATSSEGVEAPPAQPKSAAGEVAAHEARAEAAVEPLSGSEQPSRDLRSLAASIDGDIN
jgi:hypothetical protein